MNNRAQGTIEYLVIVAIVVVIALVVVGLLLQIMNQGAGISESTAKNAWRTTEPWSIVDWSRSANVVTVVLQNNTFEVLTFNSIYLNASDNNDTETANVAPGSRIVKTITEDTVGCTSGLRYSIDKAGIYIDFDTPNISNIIQRAPANIVGTC